MKTTQSILSLIAALFFLYSCSLERQMYTRDHRTKWHATGKGRLKSESAKPSKREAETAVLDYREDASTASAETPQRPDSIAEESEAIFSRVNTEARPALKQSNWALTMRGFRGQYSNPLEMNPFERFISRQAAETLSNDSPRTEGFSVASLVLGIVGWFIPYVGLLCCLLAVIFGIIGIVKISNNPDKFKGMGMAIAGLVLGVLGIGVVLLLMALLF
jgi:hypothetical protein